jgi:hypothetical protein
MMRINKLAAAVLLGVSVLGLTACASTGFRTQVSRYQVMPGPQGQSFAVVPIDPNNVGGIEFSRYAELVAQRMQALGYARAPSINQATMLVRVGYDVDNGHNEVVSDPFYGGYGGYGGLGYGRGWGRGWGGYAWGWNDPFWYQPYGGGYVRSYTYYVSELDLDIRRKVDNASLFEGKAKARSRTDELSKLVPNLVDAMFTGFPGMSGETVKITIPTDRQQAKAGY